MIVKIQVTFDTVTQSVGVEGPNDKVALFGILSLAIATLTNSMRPPQVEPASRILVPKVGS